MVPTVGIPVRRSQGPHSRTIEEANPQDMALLKEHMNVFVLKTVSIYLFFPLTVLTEL